MLLEFGPTARLDVLGSLIERTFLRPITVDLAIGWVTNSADAVNGYEAVMVPPLKLQEIIYATAVCRTAAG